MSWGSVGGAPPPSPASASEGAKRPWIVQIRNGPSSLKLHGNHTDCHRVQAGP